MRIRPVEAEMFHAGGRIDGQEDGWTDRHGAADSHFSNYL